MLEGQEKTKVVNRETSNSKTDGSNTDLLRLASEVGYSLAGNIGSKAFVELELAYATRLLPRFTDDPVTRTIQNVLLFWQFAYYKSTILRMFTQAIPESFNVVDITSMTPERIFGSIDAKKKHIIQPAFTNDVHFVIISELTSLLGQRDAMRQFANIMNVALEGEKVSRQILKLGHGEISKEEFSELSAKGVFYDPVRAELSYTPNICFLGATRPLDNPSFTFLSKSGYFSRFHVILHRVTATEASEHLHRDYKLDRQALDRLKRINQELGNTKVERMLRPSESIMKPIYDNLEELVSDEVKEKPNLTFADVVNPRLKDDVIRELVSFAFLRTAAQNSFQNIEELEYSQADVDFLLGRLYHFIEFAVQPLIATRFSRIRKGSKRDRIKVAVFSYLSDRAVRHIDEIMKAVESLNASQATVYNALTELRKEGRITSLRHGYYQIVKESD